MRRVSDRTSSGRFFPTRRSELRSFLADCLANSPLMILENDFIDVAQIIAERKIAEAFERGEFNDLPGTGKPLHIDDDPFQSPGQRLVHKILKNAGLPPIEISLSRELARLKTEVQRANSAEARCALLSDIRLLTLRINLLPKRPV